MLVDCGACAVRGPACEGCLVSAVLGAPPGGVHLDEAEWHALTVLADAGMVPRLRLRLVPRPADPVDPTASADPADSTASAGPTGSTGPTDATRPAVAPIPAVAPPPTGPARRRRSPRPSMRDVA